ncbi:MAG TPA: hypothetical protein VFH47_00990 [Candidatus Thermoplasmatota archaeon]|nr:hypothetical protein [Candidatus Thermoplasmatota archaeon]
MKWSSRAWAAVVLLGLAAAAFAVASMGAEQQVVRVEDLVGPDPPQGKRLLVGIPQPATLPVLGGSGAVENPQHPQAVPRAVAWRSGDQVLHSVVTVRAFPEGASTRFEVENVTRLPGQAEPLDRQTHSFRALGLAVPVMAFDDGDSDFPFVWTLVRPSHVKDPMRDVPSQFEGRLLLQDSEGAPLPAGVVVFEATSFKAGCSSKFLPEPERQRQQAREAEGESAAAA